MLLINSYFKILDGILSVTYKVIPPTHPEQSLLTHAIMKQVLLTNTTPFVLPGILPSIDYYPKEHTLNLQLQTAARLLTDGLQPAAELCESATTSSWHVSGD